MKIEIKRLTPELVDDYVHFFDTTPHDTHEDEHKCYCVWWCNDDYEGKDISTAEARRKLSIDYVKKGNIQGYLAYVNNQVVAWCNANIKSDCLKCAGWRLLMKDVPVENSESNIKVKSVYCFVVAPHMKRKGIATQLLERVCEDAKAEGFDYVEAYPYKNLKFQSSEFCGYTEMYLKCGFEVFVDSEKGIVVRKNLK